MTKKKAPYLSGICKKIAEKVTLAFEITNNLFTQIRRIDFSNYFAPKRILVQKYWLSKLVINELGNLDLIKLKIYELEHPLPIDEAHQNLISDWHIIEGEDKSNVIYPLFCFEKISPLFEGIKSLLLPKLPCTIIKQIASLKLEDPIEIRTMIGSSTTGYVGKSIFDVSAERMTIIGNSSFIEEYIKTIGYRFTFTKFEKEELAEQIKKFLSSYNPTPLGLNFLLAGLGAIFSFEAAFIFNQIMQMSQISFGKLFSFILSIFSIIVFLVQEMFEDKIVAFACKWTMFFRKVAWITFLAILFVSPIFLIVGASPLTYLLGLRFTSLLIIICYFIANLGQIFYEIGLTKSITLILLLALFFIILFLPFLANSPLDWMKKYI